MQQHDHSVQRSVLNWLGLVILALVVVGLVYASGKGQSRSEREDVRPFSSPTAALLSPQPVTLLSPLSAEVSSPLPSPPPTTHPATPDGDRDIFRLTLLHTNDTWGYLLPCG